MRQGSLSWKAAARIAAREVRAAAGRFGFVIVAVALGVGALTGVRSFSQAFRSTLLAQARTLMAGDIELPAPVALTSAENRELAALDQHGVRWTRITESVSMVAAGVSSAGADAPMLATLKAVDPRAYPFDGAVETTPPGALTQLDDQTVLASPDLLLRAQLRPGETLSVGGQPFRIVGVLNSEPDRLVSGFGLGGRLLLTAGGLRRTGIIQFGSQVRSRLVFQLGAAAPPLAAVEAGLRGAFPDAHPEDYRHINPTLERGLDHSTTFLTFISLIALIVAALGVASAMHAHLQLRMDTIATMKVLGARNADLLRIYGLQTLLLGSAGGVLGVGVGAAAERALPRLLARYFPALPALGWAWGPAAEGWAAGVLITLLFTLPTLLSVRRVAPALILRRHMEAERSAASIWRRGLDALPATLLPLAGVAALAVALTDEPWRTALRTGGYFLLGLAVAVGVLTALTWVLLWLLRRVIGWGGARFPVALRHGFANLYRPGNQALPVMIALGIGVMFTLSIFLLQRSLLADLDRGAPATMPNVFLIDIPPQQQPAVLALLRHAPGLEAPPELQRTAGIRVAQAGARERREFILSAFAAMPPSIDLVRGRWWSAAPAAPEVAVSQALAQNLHLQVGDRLAWSAAGTDFSAPIAAIYRPQPQQMIARVDVIAPLGPLSAPAVNVNGAARLQPAAVPELERAMYARFPTVTVINVADVVARIRAVVDQIALVVHFISFFAVLAAAIILASSVAGTRFRRMREIAVLKTFGATRGRIARIFSTEFLLLGGVAGVAGTLLAVGFTRLLTRRLLAVPFSVDWAPAVAAIAASAGLAVAAGWLASARILGLKPLDVLRSDR